MPEPVILGQVNDKISLNKRGPPCAESACAHPGKDGIDWGFKPLGQILGGGEAGFALAIPSNCRNTWAPSEVSKTNTQKVAEEWVKMAGTSRMDPAPRPLQRFRSGALIQITFPGPFPGSSVVLSSSSNARLPQHPEPHWQGFPDDAQQHPASTTLRTGFSRLPRAGKVSGIAEFPNKWTNATTSRASLTVVCGIQRLRESNRMRYRFPKGGMDLGIQLHHFGNSGIWQGNYALPSKMLENCRKKSIFNPPGTTSGWHLEGIAFPSPGQARQPGLLPTCFLQAP